MKRDEIHTGEDVAADGSGAIAPAVTDAGEADAADFMGTGVLWVVTEADDLDGLTMSTWAAALVSPR